MSTGSETAGGAVRAYEPRHEARVLRWASSGAADEALALSDEQKQAAAQLHELLRALARLKGDARDPAKGMKRFLPPIDQDRRNQVLLLDGMRGSGKTALLVTLLDLWNAIIVGRPVKEGDDRDQKMKAWGISANAWPLVPVGMLDLQPLPAHTPVLLRIVECFARVVEAIDHRARRALRLAPPRRRPPPRDALLRPRAHLSPRGRARRRGPRAALLAVPAGPLRVVSPPHAAAGDGGARLVHVLLQPDQLLP